MFKIFIRVYFYDPAISSTPSLSRQELMHREWKIESAGSTLSLLQRFPRERISRYAGTADREGTRRSPRYYFQALVSRTSVVRTIVRQAWLLRLETQDFSYPFYWLILRLLVTIALSLSLFHIRSSYFPRLIGAEILLTSSKANCSLVEFQFSMLILLYV